MFRIYAMISMYDVFLLVFDFAVGFELEHALWLEWRELERARDIDASTCISDPWHTGTRPTGRVI
jgi:hypothetical protein